jgi:hypothetical protein
MKFLMDSCGEYIASVIDRRLYSPAGDNIGHYLPELDIFIDQSGRYLGEIVSDDRLMFGVASPHQAVGFAVAATMEVLAPAAGRCAGRTSASWPGSQTSRPTV